MLLCCLLLVHGFHSCIKPTTNKETTTTSSSCRTITTMTHHRLVILYGMGGLSDVGRHAVQAALEQTPEVVEHVTVLTEHPELLDESNWNCGCPDPHALTEADRTRLTVVPVPSWKKKNSADVDALLEPHFADATAVVSCLGNRNATVGHWVSHAGNLAVIRAVQQQQRKNKDLRTRRVVVCSSIGIEEDWPPMEMFPLGRAIMTAIYLTLGYALFRDLTAMERAYRATAPEEIDYLLVRPVGIGEEVRPAGTWELQKEKYVDDVGFNMAKLDVARFMVQEAIKPTRHREAVVIGPGVEKKPEAEQE